MNASVNYEGASAIGKERTAILEAVRFAFEGRYPGNVEPADSIEAVKYRRAVLSLEIMEKASRTSVDSSEREEVMLYFDAALREFVLARRTNNTD